MTPGQRAHIQLAGRRRASTWSIWAVMGLVAVTLGTWSWTISEVRQMERALELQQALDPVPRAELRHVVQADNARHLRVRARLEDLDRRVGVLATVLEVLEHRRGNEPPRLLDEAR